MSALRVVIADDHALFRGGVRALLSTADGIEVVAEAADADEAVSVTRASHPDVVLMDLDMPGGGLAATAAIAAELPNVAVLVLTMFEDDDSVFAAMRAGARGYVLKDGEAEDLVRAITAAAHGDAIFGPAIAARMAGFFAHAREGGQGAFADLTASEQSVLRLMARGERNPAIARELSFSEKTVRNYVSSIFRKLQVADRSEAIVRARDAGLHRTDG